MNILAKFKAWREERRFMKMLQLVEEFGLHAVKLHSIGDTTYIVHPNGTMRRLGKEEPVKGRRRT